MRWSNESNEPDRPYAPSNLRYYNIRFSGRAETKVEMMHEANVATGVSNSRPVYTRVTIIGLLLIAIAALLVTITGIIDRFTLALAYGIPVLILSPLIAGLSLKFGRVVLIGAGLLGLIGLGDSVSQTFRLSNPDSFFDFSPSVLLIGGGLLASVGAVVGFVRSRRSSEHVVAKGIERAGIGLIVLALMALVTLSGVLTVTGHETVSAEDKVGVTELMMKKIRFQPDQLEIRAGEVTRVSVKNSDLLGDTFTVDELGIDVTIGPRSEVLVDLPALDPGTFSYTCKVFGHDQMRGTLLVRE